MSLAESLRVEMTPYNIDVRLISPGFVRTPLTDKNNFAMPSMIEPDEAARRIIHGLQGPAFEIHFPKRFTWKMKLLRILPNWLFLRIACGIKLL
jgi:short-subunit dehydrogenase